jgi:hypothetical protein
MDIAAFLSSWYAELMRTAPLREGELHPFETFKDSPIVKAALFALKMNSPSYVHDFTLLETNLETCLQLKSLQAVPRSIITDALRQVRQMKKAEQ